MTTGDWFIVAASVSVPAVCLIGFVVTQTNWRRLFGLASLEEVRFMRRAAEAQERVGQIFSSATRRMERRSGEGDPFNFGDWRNW